MAKIDKETKEKIINELGLPYGRVYLKCDNDEITLSCESLKSLKFGICIYINGAFKGEWVINEESPERKYLRKMEKYAYTAKFRQMALKAFGKRCFKAEGYDKKITVIVPWFTSGKTAINHLCKVCDNIEVLHIGYKP